jgi:hypothetical protein
MVRFKRPPSYQEAPVIEPFSARRCAGLQRRYGRIQPRRADSALPQHLPRVLHNHQENKNPSIKLQT